MPAVTRTATPLHYLGNDAGQPFRAVFSPTIEDRDIAAGYPSVQCKTLAKGIQKGLVFLRRPRVDEADASRGDFGRRRAPGDCGSGEGQEIPPSHPETPFRLGTFDPGSPILSPAAAS